MLRLSGILAPVVTTFLPVTGELDRAAFTDNVRAHMAAKASRSRAAMLRT